MAEIKFPKIEVEPADMERLENIVKRFEDVCSRLEKILTVELDNIPFYEHPAFLGVHDTDEYYQEELEDDCEDDPRRNGAVWNGVN